MEYLSCYGDAPSVFAPSYPAAEVCEPSSCAYRAALSPMYGGAVFGSGESRNLVQNFLMLSVRFLLIFLSARISFSFMTTRCSSPSPHSRRLIHVEWGDLPRDLFGDVVGDKGRKQYLPPILLFPSSFLQMLEKAGENTH